jgi:hypothetical protein
MNKAIASDLKALFIIQLLSSALTGLMGTLAPGLIIALSGLDPAAVPVMQQAGGLSLGYTVGAILSLRAAAWEQVRIFVAGSLVAYGLSLLGAIYYIFIVGVVSLGLIVIFTACLIMTIGLIYAWRKYERPTGSHTLAGRSA